MGHLQRRDFLFVVGALLASPVSVRAQRPGRMYRIGVMSLSVPRENYIVIPEELRKLGFEEGRNLTFEYRFAYRDPEKLPGFAADLVARNVDVIIADLPREILAARHATSTIPIVMRFGMVPKELGLIESLARPGGNVTGTLLQAPEATAKGMQIIRDIMGRQAKVAMLYQPDFPGLEPYMRQSEHVATLMSLRPTMLPVSTVEELDTALQRIAKERPSTLFAVPTGVLGRETERVLKFAADHRTPAVYSTKWPVELGALLAYEADLREVQVRTAAIVARILNGANPAEIPVEEPTRFELWINMKTAKTLGIKIPQSVLLQSTRIFD